MEDSGLSEHEFRHFICELCIKQGEDCSDGCILEERPSEIREPNYGSESFKRVVKRL